MSYFPLLFVSIVSCHEPDIYIDSITRGVDRKHMFACAADVDNDNKPEVVYISWDKFSRKGLLYKVFSFSRYINGKFEKFWEMKKCNGSYFFKEGEKEYPPSKGESEIRYLKSLGIFRKKLTIIEEIVEPHNNYALKWLYFDRVRNFYFTGNWYELSDINELGFWFAYNYPDNSDKWPKKAKGNFKKIEKKDKWNFIHKGDILKSGNPTVLMLNYKDMEVGDTNRMTLQKLKILEYKKGKWQERFKVIKDDIHIDGKSQKDILFTDERLAYFDAEFSSGGENRAIEISFSIGSGMVHPYFKYTGNTFDNSYEGLGVDDGG